MATIRLRQALSQGLLIKAPDDAKLDDDYTEALNVKRYEPPVPKHFAGDSINTPSAFTKYTSIENYKNYPDVLVEGENVLITLKIHGSNFRAGFIDDGKIEGLTYIVGSHNVAKDKDGTNIYSQMSQQLDIENKLKPIIEKVNPKYNFIVFGEIFGSGIQDLTYDCIHGETKLRLFDVMIDGKYQPWEYVQEIAAVIGVDTVPVLYRGPYSYESAVKFRDGKDLLGNHVREGIIIKSEFEENYDYKIGRRVIKMISDDYLLRKGGTDSH